MNELLDLYITFVKIGCVNFGGGYAMLPLLERELVDKRHWTTMDDLRDYFSIGQCTPGIIALNVSTFIGEKKAGVIGALCATTGFLTGPIAIILAIAAFLSNFADLEIVQHAFAGIRVCVCVLILQAVMRLWKKSVVDRFTLFLYLVIFALHAFSGVLPVKIPAAVLVICAGVIGVLVSMRNRKAASAKANADAGKEEMLEFFKTGLFSVGGGLATLPFLYEMSDKTGWFSHADIADMIAISESTPGAIGINMSTYAGFKTAGFPGGILATLSLAAPSVIIILIIAKFLNKFRENPNVEGAFYGLRPASIAMITAAGLNVAKVALVNLSAYEASGNPADLFLPKAIVLAILIFIGQKKLKWSPIVFILISAVVGIILRF